MLRVHIKGEILGDDSKLVIATPKENKNLTKDTQTTLVKLLNDLNIYQPYLLEDHNKRVIVFNCTIFPVFYVIQVYS